MRVLAVCALLLLGGCTLPAIFGFTIMAAGAYSNDNPDLGTPQLAPERRVSEQDCTKPVDFTQGNIRCK
ncbi:MAG: hypothetical protein K0R40_4376 [Burkholderiales bacterium]|jgi:hypothetical protein|nr:hypothetical protein [Burkholderiales bacterium]